MGDVLIASLLAALGMSLSYIPGTIASMSGAKPQETGLASGLVNTSYQIGSALGLAAMVALSSSKTSSFLQAGTEQIRALNSGFHAAFIGAALISGIATVIALLFVKNK
jgi:hypothetical protein